MKRRHNSGRLDRGMAPAAPAPGPRPWSPPGKVSTPQPGSADGRPVPGRARKPATAVPGMARCGASAAGTQSQKARGCWCAPGPNTPRAPSGSSPCRWAYSTRPTEWRSCGRSPGVRKTPSWRERSPRVLRSAAGPVTLGVALARAHWRQSAGFVPRRSHWSRRFFFRECRGIHHCQPASHLRAGAPSA
jgi:hypothetical protein